MKPTPDQIHYFLPDAPSGFHYQVEQVGALTHKVWLVHERDYVYAEGEQVKTIWGFIKHNKVFPPKNAKTARTKSCCSLLDAHTLPGYSCIVPSTTDLTHLL